MTKRILIISLLIFLLFTALLFVFKDYLLKVRISHYLNKEFAATTRMGGAKLSLNGFVVEDFSSFNQDMTVKAKRVEIDISFFRGSRVSRVFVDRACIKIKDSRKVKNTFREKFAPSYAGPRRAQAKDRAFSLDVRDIKAEVQGPDDLGLKSAFSFHGDFQGSQIKKIKTLEISGCKLQFKNSNISLTLKKVKDNFYILNVSSLIVQDREVKGISIPLTIDADKLSFSWMDADFPGSSALIAGFLNYEDYSRICLTADLENSSFKNVLDFIGGEEDFCFEGDFNGKLQLCLEGGRISEIRGDLLNTGGGLINIKKEASLEFLRKYLDKASYQALVDNFTYYTYNKGRIKIGKKEDAITLHMQFISDRLGRRNIWVNLHNILGGGE